MEMRDQLNCQPNWKYQNTANQKHGQCHSSKEAGQIGDRLSYKFVHIILRFLLEGFEFPTHLYCPQRPSACR